MAILWLRCASQQLGILKKQHFQKETRGGGESSIKGKYQKTGPVSDQDTQLLLTHFSSLLGLRLNRKAGILPWPASLFQIGLPTICSRMVILKIPGYSPKQHACAGPMNKASGVHTLINKTYQRARLGVATQLNFTQDWFRSWLLRSD